MSTNNTSGISISSLFDRNDMTSNTLLLFSIIFGVIALIIVGLTVWFIVRVNRSNKPKKIIGDYISLVKADIQTRNELNNNLDFRDSVLGAILKDENELGNATDVKELADKLYARDPNYDLENMMIMNTEKWKLKRAIKDNGYSYDVLKNTNNFDHDGNPYYRQYWEQNRDNILPCD